MDKKTDNMIPEEILSRLKSTALFYEIQEMLEQEQQEKEKKDDDQT